MEQTGKALMVVGLIVAAMGGLMWLGFFRWLRFGRLPGDIVIERPYSSIYIPVTSMILVSVFLTLISLLVAYFRR